MKMTIFWDVAPWRQQEDLKSRSGTINNYNVRLRKEIDEGLGRRVDERR